MMERFLQMQNETSKGYSVLFQALMLAGLLIGGVFISSTFVSDRVWLVRQSSNSFSLQKQIPTQFGDWSEIKNGLEVEVEPEARKALDALYSQQLTRTYINSQGYKIMLSIAYGNDQSSDFTQAHRPEICYVAQGFSLTEAYDSSIVLPHYALGVRRLVAHQDNRNEPIIYWMVVGDKIVKPGLERKAAQLHYALKQIVPDGLLFRVSAIDENEHDSFIMQQQFVTDLFSAVDKQTLIKIAGQPNE